MPTPIRITESKQLLVEGRSPEIFFGELLNHMDLSGIQLQDFKGIKDLPAFLKGLRIAPNFAEVVSLGIVRDAEDNPTAAFQSVCSALQNANLGKPDKPCIFEANTPRIGALILPDANRKGMLETLCLQSVESDPVIPCIDEYFCCIKQIGVLPRVMDKARLLAFLASRYESVSQLGRASQKNCWPWDDCAFDHVRQFLRNL